MELRIMGESQFADIENLTRLIYEAKDRLAAANGFNERIKIKFEIKQLVNARDELGRN